MKSNDFREKISILIEEDDAPVVVFSALWPFMRVFNLRDEKLAFAILSVLSEVVTDKKRTLMMPTFSNGYKNGFCNLDLAKSTTGVLSELFRQMPNVKRSLSAFFSFAFSDNNKLFSQEIMDLKPTYAWGQGSLYEWMEQKNVHFLMIGVHPTHCSYLHRMEWLVNNKITYRYNRSFQGVVLQKGREFCLSETLYVRSLTPEAINDFTVILPVLMSGGMRILNTDGASIAHMRALDMKNAMLSLMNQNPLAVLKNRNDFI